ncbi:hypothetical protein CBF30_06640 [Vagococcus entomophilus]|uniref:DUF3324 domain-containing protein n=2 Tax=Vagococcus entomophilus TaxID=1160095 RepID=A0A430AGC3_9ENTE|nr:hypothetical protein CBF30_06640 [Vagococcus entomophilus]
MVKIMNKKKWCSLLLGTIMLFAVPLLAHGETKSDNYSVSPIFSENQTTNVTSFYDIKWSPGKTEKVGVRITNNSDEDREYTLTTNKAQTNKNGIIDYSSTQKEETKGHRITEMVRFPPVVKVLAHTSQDIYTEFTFPQADFNGILMGGIHISEKKQQNSSQGVTNVIAYNIPLVIRGNIEQRPDAKIKFGTISFEKETVNHYALAMKLTNVETNFLKNVSVKVKIKNEKEKVVDEQESTVDITPETTFSYPIHLKSAYKSGKYHVEIALKHDKQVWKKSKTIVLSNDQAKQLKQSSKSKKIAGFPVIMGLLLFFVLFVIGFILLKIKKKK